MNATLKKSILRLISSFEFLETKFEFQILDSKDIELIPSVEKCEEIIENLNISLNQINHEITEMKEKLQKDEDQEEILKDNNEKNFNYLKHYLKSFETQLKKDKLQDIEKLDKE